MSFENHLSSDGIAVMDGFSRYAVLLAMIPLPLIAGVIEGLLSSVPVAYGVGAGGVLSAVLVWYALFVDTPASVE